METLRPLKRSTKLEQSSQIDQLYDNRNLEHLNQVDNMINSISTWSPTVDEGETNRLKLLLKEENKKLRIECNELQQALEIVKQKYLNLKERIKVNTLVSFSDDIHGQIELNKKLELKNKQMRQEINVVNANIKKNNERILAISSRIQSPVKDPKSKSLTKVLKTNLELSSIENEIMQEKIRSLQYECTLKDKQIKLLREKLMISPRKTFDEYPEEDSDINELNFEEEFNITYNSNLNTEAAEISNNDPIYPASAYIPEPKTKPRYDVNNVNFDVSLKKFEESKLKNEKKKVFKLPNSQAPGTKNEYMFFKQQKLSNNIRPFKN